MRLKTSFAQAEEQLVAHLNSGYALLSWLEQDHQQNGKESHDARVAQIEAWGNQVQLGLNSVFPTELELNLFLNPPEQRGLRAVGPNTDTQFLHLKERVADLLQSLNSILKESLPRYTDLPIADRLYVEDIDSFRNVRDVNPQMVADLLNAGRWDVAEDFVQMSLEQILGVAFHKKDWGGEYNDLYTANVLVNGARTASAFMLKGNGLRKSTMEIADCGKNGDQLVRLFESPAKLFFVQFIGNVSEAVVKDVAGKVAQLRSAGKECWYSIIDGQDTARLLRAYGKC